MGAAEVAFAHYRRQKTIAGRAAQGLARLWAQVDRTNIARSWAELLPRATATVAGAQLLAAQSSDDYVARVLGEQDVDGDAAGELLAEAFAGTASDGRPLSTLLFVPALTSLSAVRQGERAPRAMAAGRLHLDLLARTQVADAGRVADGVAIVARPKVTGYVRLLSPPSCSRCVVLAGRRYRWNAGFLRHPRCDCRHIPAAEDTADDLRTDPAAYFESLSPEEQDRAFTRAGAEAIRDGADVAQVVNARRGAHGLAPAGARLTAEELRTLRGGRTRGRLETTNVFGRDVFLTTENARRYRAGRLMPESIYQIADGDRDEAIRLLRRYGYIR
ncbi:hypothetical protein [Micromonospora sp. NPDC047730]|uniref:hypothetical protein n=1 Tax=Micromonospora sp. NPDC047730 TaxID=3364253 RepID=UPI003723E653